MKMLRIVLLSGAATASLAAFAAGPTPAQNPDDLQPGVNTSAMPPQASETPNRPTASAPATTRAAASKPPTAAANSKAAGTRATPPAAEAKSAKNGKAVDRLDLDATQITGNKELPKVMYVVPWKRADLGDLTGKPANSLVDEVLQPVDRDVFNREERYYHTVAPQKSPADAPSQAAAAP